MIYISLLPLSNSFLFFFNDTATTEIYTLSLHDALPIYYVFSYFVRAQGGDPLGHFGKVFNPEFPHHTTMTVLVKRDRSEEHTSELQSQSNLVCRLLLEKKKQIHLVRALLLLLCLLRRRR